MNAQLAPQSTLPANVYSIDGTDILYTTLNERLAHREALKAAADLPVVEGHGPWELATLKEVALLVDHSKFDPAVNTELHPGIDATWYWLKDTYAPSPSVYAWSVGFGYGDVNCSLRDIHGRALAVCRPLPASQQ